MSVSIKNALVTFPKVYEGDAGVDLVQGEFERYYKGVDLYGLNAFIKVRFSDDSIDKFLLSKTVDGDKMVVNRVIDGGLSRMAGKNQAQIVLENEQGNVIVNSRTFTICVSESVKDETNDYTVIPSAVTELQRELQGEVNRIGEDIERLEDDIADIETFMEGDFVKTINGEKGNVTLDRSSVGLNNVDNTSDLNKPVSLAVAAALNKKVDKKNVSLSTTLSELAGTAGVMSFRFDQDYLFSYQVTYLNGVYRFEIEALFGRERFFGESAEDLPLSVVTSESYEDDYALDSDLGGKQDILTFDNVPTSGSNNPVKSGGVFAAIQDIKDGVENGSIVAEKAKLTKQIENVSEDSGSTQTAPFIFQGTGTNNNTTATPTAPIAKQLELRGNSVVVNQVRVNDLISGSGSTSNAYGSIGRSSAALVYGNKYLVMFDVRNASDNVNTHGYSFRLGNGSYNEFIIWVSYNTSWQHYAKVDTLTLIGGGGAQYNNVFFQNGNYNEKLSIEWKNLYVIDLTKWFGKNDLIPQDLLDHPETFENYYRGSLDHNAGEIVSANADKLITTGFNQYDPEAGYAKVIGGQTYHIGGTYTALAFSKTTSGGESVTLENDLFTPRENGYIIVTGGNAEDTIVNLSWDGERDGTYEAYIKREYALGNDVLRSAGSAYDQKLPDGTIVRRVGTRAYRSGDENDDSVMTDGVTTYYPLAAPVTERGTPFAENVEVDDYGTMEFSQTNGIPQGNKFFYPADYVLLADDLNNYVDGSVDKLAKKTDLIPAPPSFDGEYALKATVVDGAITYSWEIVS